MQNCLDDAKLPCRFEITMMVRSFYGVTSCDDATWLRWQYGIAMTTWNCNDDVAMTTNGYNHEYLWMRLFMNKTTSSTVASSSNDTNSKRWMANAEWQMENNEREINKQSSERSRRFRISMAWSSNSELPCGCGVVFKRGRYSLACWMSQNRNEFTGMQWMYGIAM